jgi:hypothetical protein
MTQLTAWKCDVCYTDYIEQENNPDSTIVSDLYIDLGSVNMFYPGVKVIYKHVCLNCRKIILGKINEALELCGHNGYIIE